MLRRQPAAFRVGVDAGKPRRNAVKQLNVLAQIAKHLTIDDELALRFLNHHIHIRENLIHLVLFHRGDAFVPKDIRLHAQIGNEAIFLHIPRGQRVVKIIHDRQNGVFFHRVSSLSWRVKVHIKSSSIIRIGKECVNWGTTGVLPQTPPRT